MSRRRIKAVVVPESNKTWTRMRSETKAQVEARRSATKASARKRSLKKKYAKPKPLTAGQKAKEIARMRVVALHLFQRWLNRPEVQAELLDSGPRWFMRRLERIAKALERRQQR